MPLAVVHRGHYNRPMSTIETVRLQALALSASERAQLANALLESLPEPPSERSTQDFKAEIAERARRARDSRSNGISRERMREMVEAKLASIS